MPDCTNTFTRAVDIYIYMYIVYFLGLTMYEPLNINSIICKATDMAKGRLRINAPNPHQPTQLISFCLNV